MRSLCHLAAVISVSLALVASVASAQTPLADPAAAWEVTGTEDLDLGATDATLSPDGTRIAGTKDRTIVCIWDIGTLDTQCLADELPVDPTSITWAPDSSAIVFSLDSARQLIDSAIFVMDAESGELGMLTDLTAGSLIDVPDRDVDVDTFPAWSPDGEVLVFVRTNIATSGTWLMTIPVAGGDPRELDGTLVGIAFGMSSPISWREDGALIYSVYGPDPDSPDNGIWRWEDGKAEQLMSGGEASDYPGARLSAITDDDAYAIGSSPVLRAQNGVTYSGDSLYFALELGTGRVEPADALLLEDLADQKQPFATFVSYPPRISPDGSAIVYAVSDLALGAVRVVVLALNEGGSPQVIYEIATLDLVEGAFGRGLDWAANNTILVPARDGSVTLVSVEPASLESTPIAPCSCTPPDGTPPA